MRDRNSRTSLFRRSLQRQRSYPHATIRLSSFKCPANVRKYGKLSTILWTLGTAKHLGIEPPGPPKPFQGAPASLAASTAFGP